MSCAVPVMVRGQLFPSMQKCAKHFGVSKGVVDRLLDDGRIDDLPVVATLPKKGQRRVRCLSTGREWSSALEAANANGMASSTMAKRAQVGHGFIYTTKGRRG